MEKIKTALKTQKFQTIKTEDPKKTPSSVKIVESERSLHIRESKSSVLINISSLSQDSVVHILNVDEFFEFKSFLAFSAFSQIFQKPKAKARFRAVKDKIVNKNKNARTTVVVPKEGENQKKNLAYYDKEIYQALKKRKDAQV
jgi:hypothetical protein